MTSDLLTISIRSFVSPIDALSNQVHFCRSSVFDQLFTSPRGGAILYVSNFTCSARESLSSNENTIRVENLERYVYRVNIMRLRHFMVAKSV